MKKLFLTSLFCLLTCLHGTAKPFHFVALGDTGYNAFEKILYQNLIVNINELDPAFSIHVGDIWGNEPSTDADYQRIKGLFMRYNHPLIYTPGDNEWADTWQPARGNHDPLERLPSLRKIFFPTSNSLGKKTLLLTRQIGMAENAIWQHDNVLFCTLHTLLPSDPRPAHKQAATAEYAQRDKANRAWLATAFQKAKKNQSKAIVLAWHAAMFNSIGEPIGRHKPFIKDLLGLAGKFDGQILIIHGDLHTYIFDKPFATAANISRLQVFGSPFTAAVKVTVDPTAKKPFTCEHINAAPKK